MRRIALLGLVLLLPGCAGFGDFLGDTVTYGTNPNSPLVNSENGRRVLGLDTSTEPLAPEPGNVWPEAIAATPTLQDLEKQGNAQQPTAPPTPSGPPYLPDHRQPRRGSSTPPGSTSPPFRLSSNPAPAVAACLLCPPPRPGPGSRCRRGRVPV